MNVKLPVIFILIIAVNPLFARNYKGAELYSNDSVLYGRFEMLIQAAAGSGQLSTFFLYRNNSETSHTLWEEIDLEIFGKDSNAFQSNVIIEKKEGARVTTEKPHKTPTSVRLFHKYVIEWTPDSINWFIDDSLYRTEKVNAQYCHNPMSIRFNHWAANISSWVGLFDTSVLPQYEKVDYLKYSSYTPGTGDNGTDFTFTWQDDFNTLDASRWSKANWTFTENLTDFLPANAYSQDNALVLKLHDALAPAPEPITSIQDESTNNINVFPNPTKGSFYVEIANIDITDIRICSSLGTEIEKIAVDGKNIFIQTTACKSNGIYFLVCMHEDTLVAVKPFMVEK